MTSGARTAGYLALTGLVCAAGWAISLRLGAGGREAARALAVAWAIQALAYALLSRRLDAGRDASGAWVAGIALRGLAIGAAWIATLLGGMARETAIVFGLALATLIILEAVWLATTTATSTRDDLRRDT